MSVPSANEPLYEYVRLVHQVKFLGGTFVAIVSTPGRGEWIYAKSKPFLFHGVGRLEHKEERELCEQLLREGWEMVPVGWGVPTTLHRPVR